MIWLLSKQRTSSQNIQLTDLSLLSQVIWKIKKYETKTSNFEHFKHFHFKERFTLRNFKHSGKIPDRGL